MAAMAWATTATRFRGSRLKEARFRSDHFTIEATWSRLGDLGTSTNIAWLLQRNPGIAARLAASCHGRRTVLRGQRDSGPPSTTSGAIRGCANRAAQWLPVELVGWHLCLAKQY